MISLSSLTSDGEFTDDWHRRLGEMLRAGVELPGGGGHHRGGRLPLLCCPSWTHWCHEAPPGSAVLCILYSAHVDSILQL